MLKKQSLITAFATLCLMAIFGASSTDPRNLGSDSAPAADQKTGKIGDNTWLLPTGQIIRPAGRQVDLPGWRPQAAILSPNGKYVAIAGGTNDALILDPVDGHELSRAAMPMEKTDSDKANAAATANLSPDKSEKMVSSQ